MRWLIAGLAALLMLGPAQASPIKASDLTSINAILHWINHYRERPDPASVPKMLHAASGFGAFENPERSGIYVGFLAGVLAENPAQAEEIAARSLTMQERDRWVVMRAIAYSGLANWQALLRRFACRMPRYDVLSDRYIRGKMATLADFEVPPSPGTFERMREKLFGKPTGPLIMEPSAEALDLWWGYYFATGSYGPVMHIVDMLPLAADHNDTDRLATGSMAKYSLASNATHDAGLLAMLKMSRKARGQSTETVKELDEVIDAAETVDTGRIRKAALAAIEEVRIKGPAYKRTASWWSYLGQPAIAGGCIAAAMMGQVEFGIPCVVGGATASAGMNFLANSP
jgi:hypothetical protein